jgi:hypothetical protein
MTGGLQLPQAISRSKPNGARSELRVTRYPACL